jgi:hypothetical protein
MEATLREESTLTDAAMLATNILTDDKTTTPGYYFDHRVQKQ